MDPPAVIGVISAPPWLSPHLYHSPGAITVTDEVAPPDREAEQV
jgi:hypothetical protein